MPTPKIVIAPDSFKGSLAAADVARAIAEGVLAVCPEALIDICPMADGGEGTVEAMVAATGGKFLTTDVFDPLGSPIRARFGMLGVTDGGGLLPGEIGLSAADAAAHGEGAAELSHTAVVEMAAASGLGLVPIDRRDPRRTTTYGTGQLILAALDAGARKIILGIGGSATNDGGAGCAQALGVEFLDADGEECVCGLAGGGLMSIATIDMSGRDKRLAAAEILVACDVTNPLTGPDGAAAVYGPQKGATEEVVRQLDAGLAHLASLIRDQLGMDVETLPGAGAAGGLGAGLVAFAGAKLTNGGKLISEAVGLPARLRGADLCITGEGKIDAQSRFGKAPVRVANLAGQAGVSTACIAGVAEEDAPRELFRDLRALVENDVTPETAMANPEELLQARARDVMRNFLQQ
ncbi:MAG: glycerate kinase [Phycisphaerae bacterium]|nr:glycerate kinase [Phycisphaerae bacterium]